MSISVIIPTHNRRHVIGRAIQSVLSQSQPADEVIIVDDGSTDGTDEMIQDKYPECRLLRQENSGVSRARNRGIQQAKGEWIALLDSDDEWLQNKLENQMALLQAHPDLLLCHTEEIWIRNGIRVNPMRKHRKSGGYIFHQCLPLCVISPSAVIIHRHLLDEVGLFDEALPACEDYDLWLRICSRHPVGFVEAPQIIKYGGHEDQLSRRHWGMDRFRITALIKAIDSGILKADDLMATRAVLLKKLEILINGASKRGKSKQVIEYTRLYERFA